MSMSHRIAVDLNVLDHPGANLFRNSAAVLMIFMRLLKLNRQRYEAEQSSSTTKSPMKHVRARKNQALSALSAGLFDGNGA